MSELVGPRAGSPGRTSGRASPQSKPELSCTWSRLPGSRRRPLARRADWHERLLGVIGGWPDRSQRTAKPVARAHSSLWAVVVVGEVFARATATRTRPSAATSPMNFRSAYDEALWPADREDMPTAPWRPMRTASRWACALVAPAGLSLRGMRRRSRVDTVSARGGRRVRHGDHLLLEDAKPEGLWRPTAARGTGEDPSRSTGAGAERTAGRHAAAGAGPQGADGGHPTRLEHVTSRLTRAIACRAAACRTNRGSKPLSGRTVRESGPVTRDSRPPSCRAGSCHAFSSSSRASAPSPFSPTRPVAGTIGQGPCPSGTPTRLPDATARQQSGCVDCSPAVSRGTARSAAGATDRLNWPRLSPSHGTNQDGTASMTEWG